MVSGHSVVWTCGQGWLEILVVEGRKKNVILDIALNKYKITDNISMRSKKKNVEEKWVENWETKTN